jgi:alpha-tubulin suppressor-like RCC1 family protein
MLAELPGLTAKSLSVGLVGTCVALTTSDVFCWGDNDWQELGPADGARAIPTPRRVPELGGVQQAVLSGTFGCALSASGRVACWGTSLLGEAGNATKRPYWPPVEVAGSEGITRLAVANSVCGVTDTGSVECWGSNVGGQLGTGRADSELSDTAHPVPTLVAGISEAVDVAVGLDFACALTHSGHVLCWGSNQFGQLGLGVTDDAYHVPKEVKW